MIGSPDHTVGLAWLEELLRLPSSEQQLNYLRSAKLLNAEGLSQLLDQAMRLARSDPGKARQLTLICSFAAQPASAPAITPRATYVRAQTHAIAGDFTTAFELIQAAYKEYEAIGEKVDALRTNLGKMHVLNELGRHQEALEAGQVILDTLEPGGEPHPEMKMIVALAYLNRGVVFETIGQYEEALNAYDIAEAYFTELQSLERIGDVNNNRGIVLVHLGRVNEALDAFEKASRIWAETGLTLPQAQTFSNLGDAHLALGNYIHSLKAFEKARDLFEKLDAQANRSILLRKTADAYLTLNLYPEALSVYQEAIGLLKQAGMTDHLARALWGMGAALIAQSRFEEAEPVLAEAASLFADAGNTPMLCSVRLEQASLRKARMDHESALQSTKQALTLVNGGKWPVQRLYACLRMADLLLPDTAAAEVYLSEAQQLTTYLNLPVLNYRLNTRLGRLRALQKRDCEAQSHLEAAVEQIEALRGNLAQEAGRASFFQDKTAAYEDLIRLHLDRGDAKSIKRAFAIAEKAKSRALIDLLTGVISPPRHISEDSSLTIRLEALQADLNATYNRFLDISESFDEIKLLELQGRAARLEQEIRRVRLEAEIRVIEPDPFSMPYSFDELQGQLPCELTLIAYHIIGEEILAFIVQKGAIEVVRRLSHVAKVQDLLHRLTAQIELFRVGGDFVHRHMTHLQKSAYRALAALYSELIEPLEFCLEQNPPQDENTPTRLVIVPHGLLHNVPFHALWDGQRYLVEVSEISYALSATIFTLCQQRGRRKLNRALIISLTDPLIPGALEEARAVASQLANAGAEINLMIGEEARQESFNRSAPGCQVLHLACHGLFRADNPMFSALKLSDGWLTAVEVLELKLENALVTLSACESGRHTVTSGDEVIGLPRAFIGAGAASVLVSLWVVHDETTVALMTHFYEYLRHGNERVAALRKAQLSIREHHPHPYYWAPFVIIGQR